MKSIYSLVCLFTLATVGYADITPATPKTSEPATCSNGSCATGSCSSCNSQGCTSHRSGLLSRLFSGRRCHCR